MSTTNPHYDHRTTTDSSGTRFIATVIAIGAVIVAVAVVAVLLAFL